MDEMDPMSILSMQKIMLHPFSQSCFYWVYFKKLESSWSKVFIPRSPHKISFFHATHDSNYTRNSRTRVLLLLTRLCAYHNMVYLFFYIYVICYMILIIIFCECSMSYYFIEEIRKLSS